MTCKTALSRFKHWLEFRLLRPIFQPIFRANQPVEPIDNLALRFRRDLEALNDVPASAVNHTWRTFCDRLRTEARAGDISAFLHWPTIRLTMFGGDDDFVRKELGYLKSRDDWSSRWRPALQEDRFGGPVPSRFYLRSSATLIHQAHHLAMLEEATGQAIADFSVIVEFGGGYGSMCRLARRMGFKGTYIIFDLAPFSALQSLYLNGVGWPASPLDTESRIELNATYLSTSPKVMTAWLDANLPGATGADTLFIATWSLSESPLEIREPFVNRFELFSALLIAYQDSFEGVNNHDYFRELQHKLTGWHMTVRPIPGMTESAGRYCIADNLRRKINEVKA